MKSRTMLLLVVLALTGMAQGRNLLFEIGKADNNTAEFALGPNQSGQYSVAFPRGALFIAGQSEAKDCPLSDSRVSMMAAALPMRSRRSCQPRKASISTGTKRWSFSS